MERSAGRSAIGTARSSRGFRLGFAALTEGDLPLARGHFEEALVMERATSTGGLPHLLNALGGAKATVDATVAFAIEDREP